MTNEKKPKGYLNWSKDNPQEEESSGEQLSLFNNSQELAKRKRVDGGIVRKRYTDTIKAKGGDKEAYIEATEALTQEVMGCSNAELYKQTQAKKGQRDTLPTTAQEALMTGEIVANHDLKEQDIQGDQEERNQQIADSASKSGKKVRKFFPW